MQETIRRFVKQELEPISQKVEDENHIPEEIVVKMRELGLFGLSIPEEYGGTSEIQRMVIARELTKE
ncbi:MAG: acyl-CoA dehydrogenase family protein [Desulfobacteraceae bacterium]|nr:acyl-CoA dehydrogenase family protein [Desulfobacteraceae bacterium]